MERWLGAALEHIPRWIEHQMRLSEQPGCALAVASRGKVVLEAAYGHANLVRGMPLTPRHRLKIAGEPFVARPPGPDVGHFFRLLLVAKELA